MGLQLVAGKTEYMVYRALAGESHLQSNVEVTMPGATRMLQDVILLCCIPGEKKDI